MTPEILKGEVTVDWDIVTVLIGLEMRGVTCVVGPRGIQVTPPGALRPDERAYLKANRAEVVKILTYDPDALTTLF